jgi:hypothetical protein
VNRRGNQLHQAKAVIFDYIGTLTNVRRYTMEASIEKLYNALVAAGFSVEREKFMTSYSRSHEKYRLIRYGELREVTNAVWVSETLSCLGFDVTVDDQKLNEALRFLQGLH